MRVLYVGPDTGTSAHKVHALERLGHVVRQVDPEPMVPGNSLLRKFHWETGGVFAANAVAKRYMAALGSDEFEAVWVDNGRYVGPPLMKALRQRSKAILNYNHDDPYGRRDRGSWALYLKTVPYYDLVAVVRKENVAEANARGARHVELVFRSADEVAHRPRELTPQEIVKYTSDVVFVGTALDERSGFMAELIRRGVPLTIFGDRWDRMPDWPTIRNTWKGPGTRTDDEYSAAILGSKISLGLLSSGNRDLHTTRSLEIPALGALFCAQRTSEHEELYVDGEEAVFWNDAAECAARCQELLADEPRRLRIAAAGHARAMKNGHMHERTMKTMLDKAMELASGS